MIFNLGGLVNSDGRFPEFDYTGIYEKIDDGLVGTTQNWRYKLISSGIFTPRRDMEIDVFCVGGGAAGGLYAGGAGGKTTTQKKVMLTAGSNYTVNIGAGGIANGANGTDGGTTEGFGVVAVGGICPKEAMTAVTAIGGSGGGAYGGWWNYNSTYYVGGNGGSDGGNGTSSNTNLWLGGAGQGTTTREFGESGATLYAGGGSGGAEHSGRLNSGIPGDGGGGRGAMFGDAGTKGVDGLGGGGGGGNDYDSWGRDGGDGIVIIRNAR